MARQVRLAAPAASASLARVAYVFHGLTVQPPHASARKAPVGTQVVNTESASTLAGQKASFRFRDSSALHLNQRTTVVFRSPTETDLSRGEIAQYVTPGSVHRIVTSAASASSIGTTIDVYLHGDDSTFVVLEGALLVANPQGSVVVKSNEESTVGPGEKPGPPTPVNAAAVFDWTTSIPTPVLGRNIALDANGGTMAGVSSQAPGSTWSASHIQDGLLTDGWASADGQISNQFVKIGFQGGRSYLISGVVIDPAATNGDPADEDLKQFQIRVSTTGTADPDFRTVFSGTCAQAASLQRFDFPAAVLAKYVELLAVDNYGSTKRVTAAELEIVATVPGFNDPQALALDPLGTLYITDTGNDRVEKVSPQGKILAVWGSKGSAAGQFRRPYGIALDRHGRIFVADTGNHRIDVFSSPGHFLRSWSGGLTTPTTIAVGGGRVYAGDLVGHHILVFTDSGKKLADWLIAGAAAGTCGSPGALSVAPDGTVWDAYYASSGLGRFSLRLQQRAASGHVRRTVRLPGTVSLCSATGIAFGSGGSIWVTLPAGNHVEALTASGHVLARFGGSGSTPGRFLLPSGIGVGRQGAVWVVDSGNDRIQKVSATGRPLTQLG